MSRGNSTEVFKWWARLTPLTRSFVEMAGFKQFVESQPTETVRKVLLCTLVERWWDTTHTFHIAGVKMTITPYDIYRLTGLRVDGITPTFPGRFRPDRGSTLVWTWEQLLPTSLIFWVFSLLFLRTLLRRRLGWWWLFSCTWLVQP